MISKIEIKSGRELKESYESFVNSTHDDLQQNVVGEYVKIFNISEWVHIAFMRFEDETRNFEIEVEVSLPSGKCGESLGDTTAQIQLLDDLISNITYIKNLLEYGFKLSVLKEDCLWVASYQTAERPKDEIFDVLVPRG